MSRSRFDISLWTCLVLVGVGLAAVLATNARTSGKSTAKTLDRALERTLKYQARISLIKELYGPVEALRQQGQSQAALLKLAEIEKSYPGEAHGQILKGELQTQLGALDEAVASYAAGVRLSGEYLDRDSPLSQRESIQKLVSSGLVAVNARLAVHPDNRTAQGTLKALYYLQSRLAGGCE